MLLTWTPFEIFRRRIRYKTAPRLPRLSGCCCSRYKQKITKHSIIHTNTTTLFAAKHRTTTNPPRHKHCHITLLNQATSKHHQQQNTLNMPSTYAAYYNLVEAEKSAAASRRRSSNDSDISQASTSSSSQKRKFSLKHVLEQLRPTTETLTPAGIYAPIIKQGPLFSSKQHKNHHSS
ncbi:hypothetical protein HRR90_009311 [Exophiala dermatitidis]|uniref:Uncharacterized protein n=1 Tax=Exophiala dermatitidis TaxID=5970 RepID=A0AAN6EP05_EXODE|nr:hypothetical protein HRR74_008065 [Exophiala dermatitidis]KAJ4517384.1 hypothetical protein HRR73_004436 [Exophiala dermatitidis]KAJ4548867.1 hypothetical protein HRR76_001445 [Exophiala dermatitidis]KAJ4568365.1 hypothetical protein HRR79_004591 [Exophiala dermatitidis]KAJ4579170.1 hypothetical protein HRR82_004965 [Exophiala dermatitidis]